MTKLLFAGTPQLAVPTLEALADLGLVAAVLTAPDAPSGRGRAVVPSPVKTLALKRSLTVLCPERLDAQAREQVAPLGADLLVSFAYGRIFGPKFLALFRLGGVNIHPSLLPRHRGPSPAQAAILAGDCVTGITLQTLAPGMDAGDILLQESWKLDPTTTSADILDEASRRAPGLMQRALGDWEGVISAKQPQDPAKITYTSLNRKEEGLLDWTQGALDLDRRVRAFSPWPGAFTTWEGKRLLIRQAIPVGGGAGVPGKVLGIDTVAGIRVQTGQGVLGILRLQAEGRREIDFAAFAHGAPNLIGTVLGEP